MKKSGNWLGKNEQAVVLWRYRKFLYNFYHTDTKRAIYFVEIEKKQKQTPLLLFWLGPEFQKTVIKNDCLTTIQLLKRFKGKEIRGGWNKNERYKWKRDGVKQKHDNGEEIGWTDYLQFSVTKIMKRSFLTIIKGIRESISIIIFKCWHHFHLIRHR